MNSKAILQPILASLLAFVIAAGLGLAMRWAFVLDMPEWFNFRHIQHAHSHIALLGWLFSIFYLNIVHFFGLNFDKYSKLFWALQTMVLGMLLTFPVMGYASLSIFFSTGHILLSYVFVYKVWQDLKDAKKESWHIIFVKTSLFFMALSTLGTWALGPIMAMKLKGTAIYYASIQFYLHFQFNGWFIYAVIGLALAILQQKGILLEVKKIKKFYWILTISTLLTYALAISWSTPYIGIFIVNSVGVVMQLLALVIFLQLIVAKKEEIKKIFSLYVYRLFVLALIALTLKIVIQAIIVIPYLAGVSYTIRNFVIGFIHLLMLGCLSLFSIGLISNILNRTLDTWGTWIFIVGIISSELLLFLQGFMLWQGFGFMPYYYVAIGLASGLIFVGVLIIFLRMLRLK
jgi:hypothetical protein